MIDETLEAPPGWANHSTWTVSLHRQSLRNLVMGLDIDPHRRFRQTYRFWSTKGVSQRQARALAVQQLAHDVSDAVRDCAADMIGQAPQLFQAEKSLLLDILLDAIDHTTNWEQLVVWVWDDDIRAVVDEEVTTANENCAKR